MYINWHFCFQLCYEHVYSEEEKKMNVCFSFCIEELELLCLENSITIIIINIISRCGSERYDIEVPLKIADNASNLID